MFMNIYFSLGLLHNSSLIIRDTRRGFSHPYPGVFKAAACNEGTNMRKQHPFIEILV